jgi:hypothetical protein
MRIRESWKVAAGALPLLVAAACGGGSSSGQSSFADESGDDIAKAAALDLRGLHAVRITGDLHTDGAHETLDLAVDSDGDCSGTVAVDDARAQILAVRGTVWLKPNVAFFELRAPGSGPRLERALGDRWLAAGPTTLSGVCDLDNFLKTFRDTSYATGASASGAAVVDGRAAVKIHSPAGDADVIGWIATASPHYLLRLDVVGGADPSSMTFDHFNEPVGARVPKRGDVVALTDLQRSAG